MGITSAGIGSGLNIEGIITQLMAVEARPLNTYDTKTAAYNTKLGALSSLSGSVSSFQNSLSLLTSPTAFNSLTANASNTGVITATATSTAVAGSYSVAVSQIAQAQSLNSKGVISTSTAIGAGTATTLSFQFGTVSSGTFGVTGSALGGTTAASGIPNGSLTINGKTIATSGATTSAKDLATAINALSETTGVTASAPATVSAGTLFLGFGSVDTSAGGSYSLRINGIELGSQDAGIAAGAGLTATSLDTTLSTANATTNALAAAKITYTGSAAVGDLKFFAADGSNLAINEVILGEADGGIGNKTGNLGSSTVATSAVALTSTGGSPITVAGSNPALAGLSAGSSGSYTGAGFVQDGTQASGVITLDSTSQSLSGIRDAINKANIGVSASIVSDGSATPYHLVLTSTKTGETSSMKITVSDAGAGTADPALSALLNYDPAGTQALTQTSAAQSAKLTVNGIAVTSASNSVTGAIQGVTMAVGTVGSSSVVISKNTASVTTGVQSFVKAYNDLNTTIKNLTAYNAETKSGGALLGDSGTLSIQTRLRQQLGAAVEGLDGKLTTLSQVGISFQKDGSLSLDSTKLQNAVNNNFADIAGLFSAIGSATDSLVTVSTTGTKTVPGTYALNVTTLASRGTLTGAAKLEDQTVIDPGTVWSVTLNQTDPVGATRVSDVALTAGSYTPTQLTALLRAAVNGNTSFSGNGDTVETSIDASGKLVFSSSKYGAASNIAVTAKTGTAPAALFGASTPEVGADIAGTLGGQAFTGSGQTVTGAAGSSMDGLKLVVDGGATGDRGTVTFSQGYAYQLTTLAKSFIGTDGVITGRAAGISSSIKAVATQRQTFSDRLTDIEKRYRAQYTALDVSLASMQSTQTYLTQQLASIAANN
ncbi:flagellar filament capping protein FliD [Massilia sp. S19_KUP03_FR1]|uniref:flagellar filament capping protein FliD n=1 Tax=Massilia sp. S19_KUP03_FR1 TaxID=3025503 RepID=UPI002FCD8463